jgi:hypothetical protein
LGYQAIDCNVEGLCLRRRFAVELVGFGLCDGPVGLASVLLSSCLASGDAVCGAKTSNEATVCLPLKEYLKQVGFTF